MKTVMHFSSFYRTCVSRISSFCWRNWTKPESCK